MINFLLYSNKPRLLCPIVCSNSLTSCLRRPETAGQRWRGCWRRRSSGSLRITTSTSWTRTPTSPEWRSDRSPTSARTTRGQRTLPSGFSRTTSDIQASTGRAQNFITSKSSPLFFPECFSLRCAWSWCLLVTTV